MTAQERRILADPRFRELVGKRRRLTVWLTGLLLSAYTVFCFASVWAPGVLGAPLREGAAITIGITAAYTIIFAAIVAAGYYVHRANTDLNVLLEALRENEQR